MFARSIPRLFSCLRSDQTRQNHHPVPRGRGNSISEQPTSSGSEVAASHEDTYFIGDQRQPGFAIVINVEHFEDTSRRRRGSDVDTQRMIEVFSHLNAQVMVHRDGTASEILGFLKEHSEKMDEKYDFFACVLMSYGGKDYIEGSDSVHVKLEDVCRMFGGENCKALDGKPKLFFVQTSQERSLNFEVGADMLVVSSLIAGCCDHLDVAEGSKFISSLHEVFMKNSSREDLWTMLNMVGYRMQEQKKKYPQRFRFNLVARLRRSNLFFRVIAKRKKSWNRA